MIDLTNPVRLHTSMMYEVEYLNRELHTGEPDLMLGRGAVKIPLVHDTKVMVVILELAVDMVGGPRLILLLTA